MTIIDLKMELTPDGYYDLVVENGQLKTTDGFESAILISFYCEKRALESEVLRPEFRRGWWGNAFLGFGDFEMGSKLWLLEQARADIITELNARAYATDAYQWMVDNNYIERQEVNTRYDSYGALLLFISLYISANLTISKGFRLWQNTFHELGFDE